MKTKEQTMKTPAPGDRFYLDGFVYVLGETQARYTADGAIALRRWHRPEPLDAAEAAAYKANANYKRGGLATEAELVWLEPLDLNDEIQVQALRLATGNVRRAVWARACVAQQADQTVGAWTMPGRLLVKPPTVILEDGSEAVLEPMVPAQAEEVIAALLRHTFNNMMGG
jgi:hypothetical protein